MWKHQLLNAMLFNGDCTRGVVVDDPAHSGAESIDNIPAIKWRFTVLREYSGIAFPLPGAQQE
jgi:hypothetical protein